MTRTVNGEHLFGIGDREMLRKMIRRVADFCGVEVLTYCCMPNHFHILVTVEPVDWLPDEELLRRYSVLYPRPTKYQAQSIASMRKKLEEGGEEAEAVRSRLLARMGDVSQFMSTLKQRFAFWFNRTHGRFGTLWADRFKSVLVECGGNPLQTMAAYIDLNPVRAGFVDNPKDYRFSGYGEACAGIEVARLGLVGVWRDWIGSGGDLKAKAMRAHRNLLFGKGSSPWTCKGKVIDRREAVRVLEKEDGVLSKPALLRCRVRYFTDGAILGTAAFVASLSDLWKTKSGAKKTPVVRAVRGGGWGDLAVARDLRRNLFG